MALTKITNRTVLFGLLFHILWNVNPAVAQPPTRGPHSPGYVPATELPDGAIPSPGSNGSFIIGPTHDPVPQSMVQPNVPQGTIYRFTMDSKDSKIYPGIAREPNAFGSADPVNPAKLVVTSSHPAPIRARWQCMFQDSTPLVR